MAEAVIALAFDRLTDQLLEGLDRSAGEQAMKINKAIDDMKGFLNDADRRRGSNEAVEGWVEKARGLAHRVEDVVDGYRTRSVLTSRFLVVSVELCFYLPFSFIDTSFPLSLVFFIFPCVFTLLWSVEGFVARWFFSRSLEVISKEIQHVLGEMEGHKFELTVKEPVPHRIGTTSRFSLSDIVGMDNQLAELNRLLLKKSDAQQCCDLIFITGAMGTGKTTLAAKAFQETKILFDCHSWTFVSQPYSTKDAMREVLIGLYESSSDSSSGVTVDDMDIDKLCSAISRYLAGKTYLLVLDDLQDSQIWYDLKAVLPTGCWGKVMLTTRNAGLPNIVASNNPPTRPDLPGPSNPQIDKPYIINLKELSAEDSMTLFSIRALPHQELGSFPKELSGIAEAILNKCQRLPMSIVTVGSLLATKASTPEEWKKVYDHLDEHLFPSHSGPTGQDEDVFVSSGYADLSPVLKQCFLYCGMFPENYRIPRRKLVRLWVAEGFAEKISGMTKEEVAEQQLDQLIERNMIQVAKIGLNGEVESCRMLRLMSGLSRYMSMRDNFCMVDYRRHNHSEDSALRWKGLRRLSTDDADKVLSSGLHSAPKLRSLLYFGPQGQQLSSIQPRLPLLAKMQARLMPLNVKMVRVLELQGIRIKELPHELGGLVLLRYLGLRRTGVGALPSSIVHLTELETLDIRQTDIRVLPDLHSWKKLRHIFMEGSFMDRAVDLPKGVMWLTELQTLAGAKITDDLCEQLGYLTGLRKLSIGKAHGNHSEELCKSISKMTLLCSLTIKCDWGERLKLEGMAPLLCLNKLKLGGKMDNLLSWVCSLNSLCYLYLWDSRLSADPLSALKSLNNLVLLSLYAAYEGTHLSCEENSYPNLKKLSILHSMELTSVIIMNGAMPKVEKIFFKHCPKLKEPPERMEQLENLQIVQLMEMPLAFEEKMRKKSQREKGFNVQSITKIISGP